VVKLRKIVSFCNNVFKNYYWFLILIVGLRLIILRRFQEMSNKLNVGLHYSHPKDPRSGLDPENTLYCIAVLSNPVGWKSRVPLFLQCVERLESTPNVQVIRVEHAFGNRPWEVTDAANPFHVQLRGDERHETWLKEALIKVGISRAVPHDAKYIAWIDADLTFLDAQWASKTIAALQHYAVVQPWSNSVDLSAKGEIIQNEHGSTVDKSFCAAWVDGDFREVPNADYGHSFKAPKSHYGYAWAIRKEIYDKIGILDWCVTGAADYVMALSFAGLLNLDHSSVDFIDPDTITPGYRRRLSRFVQLCSQYVRKNIGYISGTIAHNHHGSKKHRGYVSRRSVIVDSKFDPDVDLVDDWQGLPVLSGNNITLRDLLRKYFRSRNEDSLED